MPLVGKFGRKARAILEASKVGTDLEKQADYLFKKAASKSPEAQAKIMMTLSEHFCLLGHHDDCLNPNCKCKCHMGQRFIEFKDRQGSQELWGWG
jgi:hypothetical protein